MKALGKAHKRLTDIPVYLTFLDVHLPMYVVWIDLLLIMSIKNACENLESTFVNTESKLNEVTAKVDKIVVQADSRAIAGKYLIGGLVFLHQSKSWIM